MSQAADIFACGVAVAYAATGRTPFAAHSAPAVAMRIASQPPDLAGLTGQLRDLVGRALAKRPGDRPAARELLDALLGTTPPVRSRSAPRPAALRPPPPAPVQPALRPVVPRSATAGGSRRYTRAFVVLMVLTGLLGTILTTTLYLQRTAWQHAASTPMGVHGLR